MPKQEISTLTEEADEEEVDAPKYSKEEEIYISNLQKKLESAKEQRDQPHDEFDNMSFSEYWQVNENGANTLIKSLKNKNETLFQSGTLRTKLLALLSSYQQLNLRPDIIAFDNNEIKISSLGDAMEDIIDKLDELEGGKEKLMLRQYEMLKHGYVFVEKLWEEKWKNDKTISGNIGDHKSVKITAIKKKQPGKVNTAILHGVSVYLGDLSKYMIEDQPYIFTAKIVNYNKAEAIYGKWERFKYVTKNKQNFSGDAGEEMVSNAWRLFDASQKDKVEILKFQDPVSNEFQIILNGVPMLPIGYPLTEITPDGEYTITQQNLEPIRHDFSYGKSFIFKNKNLVAVLDQMMKLAVLKTQKSFLPPYLNLGAKMISRNIFMPGQVTRGVKKNDLIPVSEKETQGVTSSEYGMVQETIKFIDRNTVSQTFTGGREEGGKVTATQVLETQRQAKMMMGLLTLAATLLEWKLAHKSLPIILKHWFDPVGQVVDQARNVLQDKYRRTSRVRTVKDEGQGLRMVIPTKEIPSSQDIRESEERFKKETGVPIRAIFLNPEEIKQAKTTWQVVVVPREKKSSEMSKMLFGAMITDAMNLGLRLNLDYIEERFAQVWEENSARMFSKEEMAPEAIEESKPSVPGGGPAAKPKIAPQIKVQA